MDIKINSFQPNISFGGRRVGFTQLQMLQKMPEYIASNMTVEQMSKETGKSHSTILKWIKDNTGKTLVHFQKQAEMESYKKILTQYTNEGKTVNEIAELIGRGPEWTKKCMLQLGLYKTRKMADQTLDEQAPKLIAEGFTIESIANALNMSTSKVKSWIERHYNKSIVKIRHKDNIRIKRYDDSKNIEWKNELADYVAKDMSLTEISRITGRPRSRLLYWLGVYGLETSHQKAHRIMTEKVPEMMRQGLKLGEMSKEVGLSDATIARWIKKTYGKSYTDLRLCK